MLSGSRMRAALLLPMVVLQASAQETCASVRVTGGDLAGVYEKGGSSNDAAFIGADAGSTNVLQAVAFGTSGTRRHLLGGGGGGGATAAGRGGNSRRGLASNCTSQMWVLADTSTVETQGFPYYATFDCAVHPASVESTWLYVECEDCSNVAPMTVVCTSAVSANDTLGSGDAGGGSALTLPVIICIAAGGLVLILCLGFCFSQHRKRGNKGRNTFADDSSHSTVQSKRGADAGGDVPGKISLPALSAAVGGEKVESSMAGGVPPPPMTTTSARGESGGGGGYGSGRHGGVLAQGPNAKSFNPNHAPAGNLPAYTGIFAPRTVGAGSGQDTPATTMPHPPAVEMSNYAMPSMRKDSMVAAAAAAAASAASATSRSQGQGGGSSRGGGSRGNGSRGGGSHRSGRGGGGIQSVEDYTQESMSDDPSGEGGRPQALRQAPQPSWPIASDVNGAGGVTWSAGQNTNHRRGIGRSEFGEDSAAGSAYDLEPPDDDDDDNVQHEYYDDDGGDNSVATISPGAYSLYSHYTAGGGTYGGPGGGDWSSDDGGSTRQDYRVGASRAGGIGQSSLNSTTIPSPAGLVSRIAQGGIGSPAPGGGGDAVGAAAAEEDREEEYRRRAAANLGRMNGAAN